MAEADRRLLERFRAELDELLGPGAEVVTIESTAGASRIGLRATCRTPVGPWAIESDGSTIIDAFASLRRRAVEQRVAIGFRELVDAG